MKAEAHVHSTFELTQDELAEALRDFLAKKEANLRTGKLQTVVNFSQAGGPSMRFQLTEGVVVHVTDDIPMGVPS